MATRISKETKAIADAHIKAKIENKFDDPVCITKEDVIAHLKAGKTFSEMMRVMEAKYATIGSSMIAHVMSHASNNYKAAIYKGFKTLLQ